MKEFTRIWALVLCLSVLLLLGGCGENSAETTALPTTTTHTVPPLTAGEKYDLAREDLEQASNWILSYTLEETRIVGQDTYSKKVEGTASFSKLMQADMVAVVEEKLSYGTYTSDYTEVYCEGAAYAQVNECTFTAEMTPEAFVARQLPAVLLDSALYQSITETVGENTTVINFGRAVGTESWLGKTNVQLIGASGTATLDNTGKLRETAAQVEYMLGQVQYSVHATVRVTAPGALDLGATHQQHFTGSTKVDSLDIPKLLLQTVGDVYASGKIHCDAVESIYSEAIPVAYSQQSTIDLIGKGETLNARAEYLIHLSDYRGNVSTTSQTDKFEDGMFTSAQNDGTPVQNPAVTPEQMRRYCEDAVLSALAAPTYLKGASLQSNADSYRLEISGNYQFMTDMMESITQFLQVDLDEKATAKKTVSAGGYLVIDKVTGLPTSMGLNMERQHTIDGITYQLNYRMDQTLVLSDYE